MGIKEFYLKLLQPNGELSSARFLNILGGFTGFFVLLWDVYIKGGADPLLYGTYLAYCGGTYVLSKSVGTKDAPKEDHKSSGE